MDWNFRFRSKLLFSVLITFGATEDQLLQYLGPLRVDRSPFTISGFSSGGNMAQQMQVAFSSCFKGSAAFAAVPYHCGNNGYRSYRFNCNFGFRSVKSFVNDAKQFEREGIIDPLSNLKHQYHYHYIPTHDTLVLGNDRVRANTAEFYRQVGMNPANIKLVFRNSDHWMPTENRHFQHCDDPIRFKIQIALLGRNSTGTAYCDYAGAYQALSYLFRKQLQSTHPNEIIRLQPLLAFNQSRYLDPLDTKYMDQTGFLYVPTNCVKGAKTCKFHVAFHGCRGSRSAIGNGFVIQSGYLEVAEKNDIIMLFPQSIPFGGNPDGCWDVFGATGPEFGTKQRCLYRRPFCLLDCAVCDKPGM